MLRTYKSILADNAEFIKLNIIQKHIYMTQVVNCQIYFLSEKSALNIILSEHLLKLKQKRTGAASGIYVPADFDTNRKNLLRHRSTEKGLK